jgi:dipeptidase
MDKKYQAIEWISMGSNTFNTFVPQYTNVNKTPNYLGNTSLTLNLNNYYWAIRMIQALADKSYAKVIQNIERYQLETMSEFHKIINKYDELLNKEFKEELLVKANNELAKRLEEETTKLLEKLLYLSNLDMKNSYSRADK